MAVGQQTGVDVATDWATLRFAISQLMSGLSTCTLVRIEACTNSGGLSPVGTVDVQPLIQMRARDASGNDTLWNHKRLYKLPYIRMQGGTNAVILDPQPGDIGLACFASRDISTAKVTPLATLQGTEGVAPGSERQFNMSDGLYIGGMLNGTPEQYVRFASGGITVLSPTKVTIEAPTIELKG